MNTRKWPAFVLLLLVLFVFVLPLTIGGADSSKSSFEKTIGEVRIVLIRVGYLNGADGDRVFTVTYAIEVPQKGAFSDLKFSSEDEVVLSVKGKPIADKDFKEISSLSAAVEKLPAAAGMKLPVEGKGRAILGEEVDFKGLKIMGDRLDVKIRFSWRGQTMAASFQDVPVR